MSLEYIDKQYRTYRLICTVELQVLSKLSRLSFKDTWKRAKKLEKKEMKKLIELLPYFFDKKIQKKIKCSPNDSFMELLEEFAENDSVQKLLEEVETGLSEDSPIKQIVYNSRRYGILEMFRTSERFVLFTFFWCTFKLTVAAMSKNISRALSKEMPTEHDVEKGFSEVKELLSEYSTIESEAKYVENRNIYNAAKNCIKQKDKKGFIKVWFEFYRKTLTDVNREVISLFVLLNTPLLDISFKEKIVDDLKNSEFKDFLQKKYDCFRTDFPRVIDWRFKDTLGVPIVHHTVEESNRPNNYNKAQLGISENLIAGVARVGRAKKINENLYRAALDLLYDYLIRKQEPKIYGRVNNECKIECSRADFVYLLGGTLLEEESVSDNPVIKWIGKDKSLMQGFFYALYYNGEKLTQRVAFKDKKVCYIYVGEDDINREGITIELKYNKETALRKKEVWKELFNKITKYLIIHKDTYN